MAKIYEGNQPFVFISYSHKDTPYVMEVVRALDESGIRVWYDGGIEAGSEWPEYIANHLTTCGCVLCFVSKNYADSDNCRRELTFSLNLKKPTLSLYMEQFEMSPGLQMQLGLVQAVFCDRFATAEALVQEIFSVPMVAACRATDDDDESFVQPTAPVVTPAPVASNPSVDAYLKRVFMFLEDGDWSAAAEYCEKVLDIDPECAEAYLGKLMAQLKVNEREQLQNCAKSFDDNNNYKKILRFGDETLKAEVVGYNDGIRARLEAERKHAEEQRNKLVLIREKFKPTKSMLAVGMKHCVGLRLDGTVIAVGENNHGQCNTGDWKDVVAVAAGSSYTVGLKSDGTVVTTQSEKSSDIADWENIVTIAAGWCRTIGLKADGRVVATDDGLYGEGKVNGWRDIVAVAVGFYHTVGLKADGTVVAVGDNENGQCNVTGWTNIVAVSAGRSHTVGLKADGTVVATKYIGDNYTNQCDVDDWSDVVAVAALAGGTIGLKADGTTVATSSWMSPWRDVTAVAAGGLSAVCLKVDGTVATTSNVKYNNDDLASWKLFNHIDTLPQELEEERIARKKREKEERIAQEKKAEERRVANAKRAEAKRKREEEERIAREKEAEEERQRVKENTKRLGAIREKIRPAQHMIGEGSHHIVGLKADGTVVAVGDYYDTSNRNPCNAERWNEIVAIDASSLHTVGLTLEGSVMFAGFDGLGNCNTYGWTDIVSIATTVDQVVGLKGNGTVVSSHKDGIQSAVATWKDIVDIAAGFRSIIGLKKDGTVVSCSSYPCGPYHVEDWRDIVAVAAGSKHVVGLKADGTVVVTGEFSQYKVDSWTDIVAVSAAHNYTVGMKADGTVVTAGSGWNWQWKVDDWKDIVAIATGLDHIVGLKADGTVVATGSNHYKECDRVKNWKLFNHIDTLEQEIQETRIARAQRREAGLCQYCGGNLKGLFFKKCVNCGESKDY